MERSRELPTFPENYKQQFLLNHEWWLENEPRARELWDKWAQGLNRTK
jgi:hypothetical protein